MANMNNPITGLRAGGLLLSVAYLLVLMVIGLMIFGVGAPEGTGDGGEVTMADNAALVNENAGMFETVGYLALFAAVFGAVASLIMARDAATTALSTIGWTALGVAQIGFIAVGAWMAGGIVPAAEEGGALFATMAGAVNAVDGIASFVAGLALGFVFLGAKNEVTAVLPRGVATTAAILAFMGSLAGVGLLTGIDGLAFSNIALLPALLIVAFWGFRIAFPAGSGATADTKSTA